MVYMKLRHSHVCDLAVYRRLLDKQQRVEAIITTMPGVSDEQKQEIEEMITPAERNQLNSVKLQTYQ